MERLAARKPLHPEIEGFGITAGDAGDANDGGGGARRRERPAGPAGADPRTVWASVGVDPALTGLAPPLPC